MSSASWLACLLCYSGIAVALTCSITSPSGAYIASTEQDVSNHCPPRQVVLPNQTPNPHAHVSISNPFVPTSAPAPRYAIPCLLSPSPNHLKSASSSHAPSVQQQRPATAHPHDASKDLLDSQHRPSIPCAPAKSHVAAAAALRQHHGAGCDCTGMEGI
jgi:hypothetical protein